jgi:hypothetical protein
VSVAIRLSSGIRSRSIRSRRDDRIYGLSLSSGYARLVNQGGRLAEPAAVQELLGGHPARWGILRLRRLDLQPVDA